MNDSTACTSIQNLFKGSRICGKYFDEKISFTQTTELIGCTNLNIWSRLSIKIYIWYICGSFFIFLLLWPFPSWSSHRTQRCITRRCYLYTSSETRLTLVIYESLSNYTFFPTYFILFNPTPNIKEITLIFNFLSKHYVLSFLIVVQFL